MKNKYTGCALFLLLGLNAFCYAQDQDLQLTVESKVEKMTTTLNLSESQAEAIKPIIKEYLTQRNELLEEAANEGIVDHVAVKETVKTLKQNEYQKLSKILTQEQMNKWVNKENLMASLNPDSVESSVDDDTTMTADGANFKF